MIAAGSVSLSIGVEGGIREPSLLTTRGEDLETVDPGLGLASDGPVVGVQRGRKGADAR